jgi:diaminohydroxyphosphoribosylaminopyrimidine deaminase/5-amino-6-(5-phosphoribosylamino)uracil reductase
LLGNFLQLDEIDEVHAFIAPKLLGGADAPSPVAGLGFASPDESLRLDAPQVQLVANDVYISGRVVHRERALRSVTD